MTQLVRTVRSRSAGLDLVLGGGPRLLRRGGESTAESATLLVRGGPGVGKSVLATDLALRLGRELGCDVLHVCIEILPSEVIAQRMGFDDFDAAAVVDLAEPQARKGSATTTLVVGMTELVDAGDAPDLGRAILDLVRVSVARGFDPRVVIVDSLSDGYGLGGAAPRATVDGVCKLAAEQGWTMVLVEEASDVHTSTWSFAVDTVLSLSVSPAGRRALMVTKHRFGACQPGPHRLLVESTGVRVIPCFAAYRNAVRDLVLPPPAAGRSLRVPSDDTSVDWSKFDVPDGQGRLVYVRIQDNLQPFTQRIGSWCRAGDAGGDLGTLLLAEAHDHPATRGGGGFLIGTLHQMIDGEEWLEAAISYLGGIASPLRRLRVGSLSKLAVYEHADSLRRAVTLLVSILARRGLLVTLYGPSVPKNQPWPVHAVIVDETWTVEQGPQDKDHVLVRVRRGGSGITFAAECTLAGESGG